MVSSKGTENSFRLFSNPKLAKPSHHHMLDKRCGRDQLLSKSNHGAVASNCNSALDKSTLSGSQIRRHVASNMRTTHWMRNPSGTTYPQASMTNKMAAVVSNKMAAVVSNKMSAVLTLSLLQCLLLPCVDAGALRVPSQDGYLASQDKVANGVAIEFPSASLKLPFKPMDHGNPLFWVMRGKKSQNSAAIPNQEETDHDYPELESESVNNSKNDISNHKQTGIEKRDVRSASSWGSNPYLLGKRPYGLPYLFVSPQKYYGGVDSDDSSVVLPGNEIALTNGLSQVMQSGKRRDGLFWATRGKRGDDYTDTISSNMNFSGNNKRSVGTKFSPALMKEAMKNTAGGDNSKFWMTRGRRFWAARGKKTPAEAVFNRLSHLVAPDLRNKGLYGFNAAIETDHELEPAMDLVDMQDDSDIVDQPSFWVVRGKKSDNSLDGDDTSVDLFDVGAGISPYSSLLYQPDDLRTKKAFNKFSALARLNANGFNAPNFWASRGRKNFWAARGKRSASEADRR